MLGHAFNAWPRDSRIQPETGCVERVFVHDKLFFGCDEDAGRVSQ